PYRYSPRQFVLPFLSPQLFWRTSFFVEALRESLRGVLRLSAQSQPNRPLQAAQIVRLLRIACVRHFRRAVRRLRSPREMPIAVLRSHAPAYVNRLLLEIAENTNSNLTRVNR